MTKEVATISSQKELYPSGETWNIMLETAKYLVESGFLPANIRKKEQALAIMLKGRELNIPAMQSFSHIHIIQGKPTISAELMLALIRSNLPGSVIQFKEISNEKCVIFAKRPEEKELTKIQFSIDDARKAKLVKENSGWDKYPRAMLRSRAVSEMARTLFPDVLMGCSYTPEELGAEVDQQGEIIIQNSSPPENINQTPVDNNNKLSSKNGNGNGKKKYPGLYKSDGSKISGTEKDAVDRELTLLNFDKNQKYKLISEVENYEELCNVITDLHSNQKSDDDDIQNAEVVSEKEPKPKQETEDALNLLRQFAQDNNINTTKLYAQFRKYHNLKTLAELKTEWVNEFIEDYLSKEEAQKLHQDYEKSEQEVENENQDVDF